MENVLFDRFVEYGQKFMVEKDELIYRPGGLQRRNCAFYLETGIVALATITKEGEEKVYLYFNGGRLIGFTQLLMEVNNREGISWKRKIGHAEIFIIARSKCVLYQLREKDFKQLMGNDVAFNRQVLYVVTENYVELLDHFQQALEESAGTRFCRLLLECYTQRNGVKVVPKSMTFLEMSRYLGTHPVTVSRIVAALKKMGCISKENGYVVIKDEERLMELIMSGEEIK